ncbi:MAG: thiamine pyrophosphate-dependent enzyme [Acidobacteriota bacterium]
MAKQKSSSLENIFHPTDYFLVSDIFPTVWCPGCGIGTAVYSFFEACKEKDIDRNDLYIISGMGCTGKISEFLCLSSSSVTDGHIIEKVIHINENNPDKKIVLFLNNADFLISGGEELNKAKNRNLNVLIIYINNFIYALSKDQAFPMTPYMRKSTQGEFEIPFNIPYLACSIGASFVARWTPIRAGWMKHSFVESFSVQGLSLVELISPCLIYDAITGRILDPVEKMAFYNDNSEIQFWVPVKNLDLRKQKKIIIGKFLDKNRAHDS